MTTDHIPCSDGDRAGDAELAPDSDRESSAARLTFAITLFAPPVVGYSVVANKLLVESCRGGAGRWSAFMEDGVLQSQGSTFRKDLPA